MARSLSERISYKGKLEDTPLAREFGENDAHQVLDKRYLIERSVCDDNSYKIFGSLVFTFCMGVAIIYLMSLAHDAGQLNNYPVNNQNNTQEIYAQPDNYQQR